MNRDPNKKIRRDQALSTDCQEIQDQYLGDMAWRFAWPYGLRTFLAVLPTI